MHPILGHEVSFANQPRCPDGRLNSQLQSTQFSLYSESNLNQISSDQVSRKMRWMGRTSERAHWDSLLSNCSSFLWTPKFLSVFGSCLCSTCTEMKIVKGAVNSLLLLNLEVLLHEIEHLYKNSTFHNCQQISAFVQGPSLQMLDLLQIDHPFEMRSNISSSDILLNSSWILTRISPMDCIPNSI